ncbi:MAG: cytochrome c biogenesis protein CcsA [Sedimentisphaerales bacterium]|nr:cytochrome c biogenesis protein CcsA [Sedimentisphaerales bacterium]
MFNLPLAEQILFVAVMGTFSLASVVTAYALFRSEEKQHMMVSLVALGISLDSAVMVFRAVEIKGVPLTGLFESLLLMTFFFGLAYLLLSMVIAQVWFHAVASWSLLGLTLLAAVVTQPASQIDPAAKTPWAIAHALLMVLGGVAVVLSMATAILYLLCDKRLKQKQLKKVLGRMPTLGRLEHINIWGLQVGYVLIGLGLLSGFGLASVRAAMLEMTLTEWITDPKTIQVLLGWLLLGLVLVLRHVVRLKGKAIAYATLLAVFFILFAMVGSRVFCGTKHDFSTADATPNYPSLRGCV